MEIMLGSVLGMVCSNTKIGGSVAKTDTELQKATIQVCLCTTWKLEDSFEVYIC